MNTISTKISIILFSIVLQSGNAQGFLNLNFELANVSSVSGGTLSTSAGFPDWTAYYGPSNNPTQIKRIKLRGVSPFYSTTLAGVGATSPSARMS